LNQPADTDQDTTFQKRLRRTAFWLAVITMLGSAFTFGMTHWYLVFIYTEDWKRLLTEHYQAIVGLPGAAAIAFAIVIFLRQIEGPVEFEALGLKFRGAAGQVVMWVFCFLAIVAAMKLLW
jgi:hypothetical protein